MTKRFQYNVNQNSIEDKGKFKAFVNTVDARRIVTLLNEQNETIQRHHQILEDMLQNERTQIGQSVLKQYKEAIQ